jgi:hypothetical protein
MRRLIALVTVAAALTGAGTASAGCWATAGVTPLPNGVDAGETWRPDIVVRQHGRTPMADATPAVLVTNTKTGEELRFPATLSDPAEGRYSADVVFPAGGDWAVSVADGFPVAECATTHTFGTFAIAGPPTPPAPPGDPGSSFPVVPLAAGLGAGALALAAAVLGLRARRGRTTAEAA